MSVSRRALPPHCRARHVDELGHLRQRRIAAAGEVRHLRQLDRQLLERHRHDAARVAVNHRNRRAPVPLARDAPVLQAELHGPLADALLLHPLAHARQRRLGRQAGELAGIDEPAVVFEGAVDLLRRVAQLGIRMDDNLDRQLVLRRKLEVALVVRRHRHDRASAVLAQHEVRDPDRNALLRERIPGVPAGEKPFLLDLAGQTLRCGPGFETRSPSCGTPPDRQRASQTSPPSRARAPETRTWRRRWCRLAS